MPRAQGTMPRAQGTMPRAHGMPRARDAPGAGDDARAHGMPRTHGMLNPRREGCRLTAVPGRGRRVQKLTAVDPGQRKSAPKVSGFDPARRVRDRESGVAM